MAFSFFRHRAHCKDISKIIKKHDTMIANTIQAAFKVASKSNMADKYFGFVARSTNLTIKVKGTFDHKQTSEIAAAIAHADSTIAEANAARVRAYALVAATTTIPIGLGVAA